MARLMAFQRTALLLNILAAACTSGPARAQLIALTNVTVIDGTGAPPQPGMTLVVRDGRIAALQPVSAPLPVGATRHDLTGKFLIPGLIDAHVHLGTRQRDPGMMEAVLRAAFLGGVTSVRDMGGRHDIVGPLAAKGNQDTTAMPRVAMAAIMSGGGDWITGDRGRFYAGDAPLGESPTVRRLLHADDVVPAIAAAKAAGATGIKIYNAVSPELVHAIADEARRQGLLVWSHLWVDPSSPSTVLAAGAEVVSHADMYVAELVADSVRRSGMTATYRDARQALYTSAAQFDHPAFARLLDTMKRQRTILDATLFVMSPAPDSSGRIVVQPRTLFASAIEFAARAHRAGVDVAAGTDAIGGSTPNLHTELQLLVDRVGMTPLEALRAATSVNARALGLDDSVGTIAVGKVADLVVLDSDPSVDIANTITVSAVMKAGRLHVRQRPMPVPPGARAPRRP